MLNIELPLVHSDNSPKFKELIGKVDGIRKLRNKVIHENRDISEEEVRNAVTVAIEFINYLRYRKY